MSIKHSIISKKHEKLSPIAEYAVKLAYLAEELACEERTHVGHNNGCAENVAEHSNMLALIAPILAEEFYPELNPNLIARYATVHDAIEAYAGDTATHFYGEINIAEKESREQEGLKNLKQEFKSVATLVKLIEDYEGQIIPEARFVRVVDKMMPILTHFPTEGRYLKRYTDGPQLIEKAKPRTDYLRENYPEYEKLILAREELHKYVAASLI